MMKFISLWSCFFAARPDRKRGCLGYREFFYPTFYKSVFSIFTYSEYRKPGFQKMRDFHISVFSIFTCSEYRKYGCLKSRIFKVFFLTCGEYQKHGCLKMIYKSWEKSPLYPRNPRFRPGLCSALPHSPRVRFQSRPKARNTSIKLWLCLQQLCCQRLLENRYDCPRRSFSFLRELIYRLLAGDYRLG